MKKMVFGFDMGKASIGYCVREGHNIKCADSVIIDKDYAEVASSRDRRRVSRTKDSHKAREDYFNKLWLDCGLNVLDKNSPLFKKEFPSKGENTIYTSCLLRIALLQNKKLEEWQIYKALYNAFQRRGYDSELPWKNALGDDDKENLELVKKYTEKNGVELIQSDNYKYPCYYDALRLGLWSENESEIFKTAPTGDKVRCTKYVAPRSMVEKELVLLFNNAKKQLPSLSKFSAEEFLYGEYKEAYGSYKNPEFQKYMGKKEDRQGVLGQKIPRFSNRVISKCKLLPKRNVCSANTIENVTLVLLMKLKNLRITTVLGEKIILNHTQINSIYEEWLKKVEKRGGKLDATITCDEVAKVVGCKILNRFDPLKANISGRSSFCRRACNIMNDVILQGVKYPETLDIMPYIDAIGTQNGITEDEVRNMLSKIGNWDNLYIPDNRDKNAEDADDIRQKTDIIIGNVTNPIVRNRLQIFRDLLIDLLEEYGKPDEVIFEFIREGDNSLYGSIKAKKAEAQMKKNEKENNEIRKELEDTDCYSVTNFEKLKLLRLQGGKCIYSGKNISVSDFDKCEIDHIFPRTLGGNDSLSNKVLCYREENQKKAGRTPYEWLSNNDEVWADYTSRVNCLKSSLGQKKFELLTSKPEDCIELIDSYNGLAETGHIARVAQQIAACIFGWGLQVEGEERRIFVNNGASTSAIRRRYGLNKLLGDDIKKNRKNDKHHALDAICISYSREFKYDKEKDKDIIEGFNPECVKKIIDKIIPYPYTHKKPLKGGIRPLETIYGLRIYNDKSYITNKISISTIEPKEKKIKTIIDEVIKNDLLEKLESGISVKDWANMLENYIHPKKKTKVKKVLTVVSEGSLEKDLNGRERIGEFVDFGTKGVKHQFKHSKQHKGQILYTNEKGNIKVMPVYSNIKLDEIKEKLQKMNCTLYNKGMMFYSGCLINIPNEFEASVYYDIKDEEGNVKTKAVRETVPAGIFKLRTMASDGTTKIENNNGVEILTSAPNLAKAKFYKCKS